jgi:hypothetical protein
MSSFKLDIAGMKDFMKVVSNLADDAKLKQEVAEWLDACGFQFLEEVQNQIVSMGVVDTRRLLNSFDKGGSGNVWRTSNGGLTLEVGTNVEYAQWVNDGHWTNPEGVAVRLVPGEWNGDKFEYKKGAETGMFLKQQWVDGRPYWDNALIIFEKMFERSFEKKMQEWAKGIGR